MADLAPIEARVGPYARGGLAITRYLGIRSAMYGRHREYHVGSREAANAIRGYTTDLDVFDEVRTQRDFTVWAALQPTVTQATTAGHGLIVAISTAGDDRTRGAAQLVGARRADRGRGRRAGRVRHDLVRAARRCAARRSARRGAWPRPPSRTGASVSTTIAESYRQLPPETFRSERLNLWSEGGDEWLPPGAWAAGEAPDPALGEAAGGARGGGVAHLGPCVDRGRPGRGRARVRDGHPRAARGGGRGGAHAAPGPRAPRAGGRGGGMAARGDRLLQLPRHRARAWRRGPRAATSPCSR